jgi:hypothetical protein
MFQIEPTEKMKALLRKAQDPTDMNGARAARSQLATALETPLRKGVMAGNIIDGIFNQMQFEYGTAIEFPLDFLAPGTEKDFTAYTIPRQGRLPERHVEGDYVMVPTYEIGSSIDFSMQYARDARWDVVGRAMNVLESAMVKKMNDDGWHTIIAAAADRNIVVFDSQANSGQFTKRLISLGKTVMRRNGGGNSTSAMRGKLTDVFLSPETIEDMRNWGVDIVDEFTRREIYLAEDHTDNVQRIFSVNLHDIDELGESQEYQNYYISELGAALSTGDLELIIGLDLTNNDSFINPVRSPVTIIENDTLAIQRRLGYFAVADVGFAIFDNRRVLILSC